MNCTSAPQEAVDEVERTRVMLRVVTSPGSEGGELITPREFRKLARQLDRAYSRSIETRDRCALVFGALRRNPDGMRKQVDQIENVIEWRESAA